MRTCDGCGTKMPAWKPRTRVDDQLLCEGCTNGRPGRPVGHHGSLVCDDCGTPTDQTTNGFTVTAGRITCTGGCKQASLTVIAHDSGDGATIYHCPFCGAGQVTARSDGTVECGFCHTYFTVQVQPQHASQPQTINGQPVQMPGMPGDPTHQQSAQQPQPTQQHDPNFAPAGSGGPAGPDGQGGFAPAGSAGQQFLPAGSGGTHTRAASKTASGRDDWDEHDDPQDEPCTCCGGTGEHPSGHECYRCDATGSESAASGECDPETLSKGALYMTPDAIAIPEQSFLAHLALRFADDRDAVLTAVRTERAAR